MEYYETLSQQMLDYYCSLAGNTPDQASDIAIRIQVLAAQLDLPEEQVVEALCATAPPISLTGNPEEGSAQLDLPVDSPEEALSDRLSLRKLVGELPPADRQLILLRYFSGKTQVQTAQALGMTQVQVSRREPLFPEGSEQLIGHVHIGPPRIGGRAAGHLIGGEVLCRNAHHLGLDPGHDVPGHQCGRGPLLQQAPADLQDPPVPAGGIHAVRQGHRDVIHLQPQRAAARKRHALQQIPLPPELLQKADLLPGIAARFSLCALQAVQFLQHGQRQNDVIVLKGLQGIGGLHEHIGIQDVSFLHGHSTFLIRIGRAARSGAGRRTGAQKRRRRHGRSGHRPAPAQEEADGCQNDWGSSAAPPEQFQILSDSSIGEVRRRHYPVPVKGR